MSTAPARALYRRIANSVTSPITNIRRREVLLDRPADVLHADAVELAPEILDEDGEVVDGSTESQAIPHKHPMVKVEPATNRIAHREVKVRVWSEGRPDDHHAGRTVTWSMAPLFVRPVEEGEEESDPAFRGDWAQAAAGHRDRFEAPAEFAASGFSRIDQEQATTTVNATGHTAIRVNLPPIAFNAARISVQLEGEEAAVELIDLEVPGIIVIDPGHGGETDRPSSSANNATSHTSGILEKDLALDFGLRVRTALRALRVGEDRNLWVHLTRDDDTNIAGAERANLGRDVGADVLVSIHFNGFNGVARGTETLVRRRSDNVNYDEDVALAQRLNDAVYGAILARDEGAIDRGIKERQLAVLSDGDLGNTAAHHPLRSALLEVEFIDNETVDELLSINENHEQVRQEIADAIANALVDDLMKSS
ncbi:N-acetylmuramoyl-L-alanine amidase [Luteimonas sp. RD2P54]|uniref:N-acetylmuramoyl-L-alanine amidase n=1 Tax=Luteimonas endophytica TaxID=3042023 RepID=A0ABT6J6M4_9GAMM|nr:N-acetylmuramoyl-L-alanine amidase [Luteimonas endophytica]MDH5822482.1 N-acetylmuramoyl-L-alanine amidase [Luteimonas endophytica]